MGYLADIEFAVAQLLTTIYEEHNQRDRLEVDLAAATAVLERAVDVRDFLAMNPDLDDEGIGTAEHWNIHFNYGPERDRAQQRVHEIRQSIATKQFSLTAMSGSVLQYGKQGISLTHGGLGACPDGRMIGSQTLKNVVWQARNQAMHTKTVTHTPGLLPASRHFKMSRETPGSGS